MTRETRDRSRLAQVLRVRRLQEKIAVADLAAARRAEAAAAAVRDAAADRYQEHQPAEVADGAAFVAGRTQAAAAAGVLARAMVAAAVATDGREQAGVAVRLAAQRVSGLERLVDRIDTAARAEADRHETRAVDDLVAGRSRRSR